jgi:hypothetical protein
MKIDDTESSYEVISKRELINRINGYPQTDTILNNQSFIPEGRVRKPPKWLSDFETY